MTVTIQSVVHIGIRVMDRDRTLAFYKKLGFELEWEGGPEPVAIVKNDSGVEINFILNGNDSADGKNVLMDIPGKHPGYTHVALQVPDIDSTRKALEENGIAISGERPHEGKIVALFIRDPDRNVIELVVDS